MLRIVAGASLSGLFGWDKLLGAVRWIRAGHAWSAHPLVALVRQTGFPLPLIAAAAAVLAESLGAALVGAGLFTRPTAAVVAASMAGAFYTSIHLREDAIRAALYIVALTSIASAGATRWSIDAWLGRPGQRVAEPSVVLRLGATLGVALMFASPVIGSAARAIYYPNHSLMSVGLVLASALLLSNTWPRVGALFGAASWAGALGASIWLAGAVPLWGADGAGNLDAILFTTIFAAIAIDHT